MFEGHYEDWRNSRMKTVHQYMGATFFQGKTLLEVGGGKGHNGNEFAKMGCKVTSTEVREEHIDVGRQLHPLLHFEIFDCNTQKIPKHYDIILHWGVLYHIEHVKSHLEDVLNKCDYLILETEVVDSEEKKCLYVEESGYDQAYHKVGSRPSASYVQDIITSAGFHFERIDDATLNSGFHRYDWTSQNNDRYEDGLRRFWICWNAKLPSPIVHKS